MSIPDYPVARVLHFELLLSQAIEAFCTRFRFRAQVSIDLPPQDPDREKMRSGFFAFEPDSGSKDYGLHIKYGEPNVTTKNVRLVDAPLLWRLEAVKKMHMLYADLVREEKKHDAAVAAALQILDTRLEDWFPPLVSPCGHADCEACNPPLDS